ncbi:retrovirus-related pol polyprotein from transposon TNT 1-94 [Tanacetum coccineum]
MDKPITHEITMLVKDPLMPLAEKTRVNASEFERVLKGDMVDDLQYVQSLEKELYELQSNKNEFSNEYDLLLQECLSKDILFVALSSMPDIDEYSKMPCKYLEKNQEMRIDLQGNDLLTGTRGYDLYTIALQESSSPTLICFLEKASPTQAWLWHRRLSHLNFDTMNLLSKNDIVNGLPNLKLVKDQLCSSCEMGKAKRSSFKSLTVTRSKKRLDLLHMDLCGPMHIETINGKKYILFIVDDYSRYTWALFLRSKHETP